MASLEDIKRESDNLRGRLVAELAAVTPRFDDDSAQILKFHGIYQQDDRDRRSGTDRDYVMMVRSSVPGGRMSGEQYLVCDDLADWIGDGTLRVTTRQGLQWHHIRKGSLRPLIWTLNQSLVTTLGACGDVVRNVVACPAPPGGTAFDPGDWAQRIADRFRPRTAAYYEVWIDGEPTVTATTEPGTAETGTAETAAGPVEPIYGDTYLPRKFKIAIAAPGDNCVDVFTHDVGLVPVLGPGRGLEAFTVLVGGGQGRSHNRPDTYSRLADPMTTVAPGEVVDVVEAVVLVQRDMGERTDRKRARLKYLIDSIGLAGFRRLVEARHGTSLPPARPVAALNPRDHFGWGAVGDDRWLGVAVENGRIGDVGRRRLRTGLRRVIDEHRPEVRLTAQQNVMLTGIPADAREDVDAVLAGHGVTPADELPPVVRDAMACVALPTCGLALTDAERALPAVVAELHGVLEDLGLGGEEIGVRMTGCPNGCARPYSTEIGLVGHRRDRYDIHVGGARDGTRLNTAVAESVPVADIVPALRPLLAAYAGDRGRGETFGDYTHRIGVDRVRSRLIPVAAVR